MEAVRKKRRQSESVLYESVEYTYLGLMHLKMAPGYFNPEWHEEYGGLYGITIPYDMLEVLEKHRNDKEEVEKLAFYSQIKGKQKIAAIDEKLLEYW